MPPRAAADERRAEDGEGGEVGGGRLVRLEEVREEAAHVERLVRVGVRVRVTARVRVRVRVRSRAGSASAVSAASAGRVADLAPAARGAGGGSGTYPADATGRAPGRV